MIDPDPSPQIIEYFLSLGKQIEALKRQLSEQDSEAESAIHDLSTAAADQLERAERQSERALLHAGFQQLQTSVHQLHTSLVQSRATADAQGAGPVQAVPRSHPAHPVHPRAERASLSGSHLPSSPSDATYARAGVSAATLDSLEHLLHADRFLALPAESEEKKTKADELAATAATATSAATRADPRADRTAAEVGGKTRLRAAVQLARFFVRLRAHIDDEQARRRDESVSEFREVYDLYVDMSRAWLYLVCKTSLLSVLNEPRMDLSCGRFSLDGGDAGDDVGALERSSRAMKIKVRVVHVLNGMNALLNSREIAVPEPLLSFVQVSEG